MMPTRDSLQKKGHTQTENEVWKNIFMQMEMKRKLE